MSFLESYREKDVLVVRKVYIYSIILCLLYNCLITSFKSCAQNRIFSLFIAIYIPELFYSY